MASKTAAWLFVVAGGLLVLMSGVLVHSQDQSCGGNCPSDNCPECYCGNTTRPVSAAHYCALYNNWSMACCECLVQMEAQGNANAVAYNNHQEYSNVGLWMIQESSWGECNGGSPPCSIASNLVCAIQ
jgi:hypothetical protein